MRFHRPHHLEHRALVTSQNGYRFNLFGALVAGLLLVSGCVVSFDGYRQRAGEDASAAGGTSVGGNAGDDASAVGGSAGSAGAGGSAVGGSAGVATGGSAGVGGSSAGAAGMAGAPAGGSAGIGAAGGLAGAGGTGGTSGAGGSGGTSGTGTGGASGSGGTSGVGGTGGASGAGGTSGSGGTGGAFECPSPVMGGPQMIAVTNVADPYCIDRTEVTNQQYSAFIAASVPTSGQPAYCSWNNNYSPEIQSGSTNCPFIQYDPTGKAAWPVTCVDWCDARAFCEWAGKRLCGRVGGSALSLAEHDDATKSEWFNACSNGGSQDFPYFGGYQPQFCNGGDTGDIYPTITAGLSNCSGGFPGINDMSGNAAEWEDGCNAGSGAFDGCLSRGGHAQALNVSTGTFPETLLCHGSGVGASNPPARTVRRDTRSLLRGFRCCHDGNM